MICIGKGIALVYLLGIENKNKEGKREMVYCPEPSCSDCMYRAESTLMELITRCPSLEYSSPRHHDDERARCFWEYTAYQSCYGLIVIGSAKKSNRKNTLNATMVHLWFVYTLCIGHVLFFSSSPRGDFPGFLLVSSHVSSHYLWGPHAISLKSAPVQEQDETGQDGAQRIFSNRARKWRIQKYLKHSRWALIFLRKFQNVWDGWWHMKYSFDSTPVYSFDLLFGAIVEGPGTH